MGQSKKKAARPNGPNRLMYNDIMARLAGFEPTTPWFVAKYSIQLSYRREARIIAEARAGLLLRKLRCENRRRFTTAYIRRCVIYCKL